MVQLTRTQLRRAYRLMKVIREFEERLHVEIATGEIPGFTHLYAGQEAVAVGVCTDLTDEDYIASTHRGHGHCIAKGCDIGGMMKEIYGRGDGLCKGKGGSMHIADFSKGMLGANAIVGGGPPLAVGAALACKLRRAGRVSVAFGGDGSCNQGTVFEAMNLAVVLQVPAIFVFEDNGYSEHTGMAYAVGSKDIAARTRGWVPAIDRRSGKARRKPCRRHRINPGAHCGINKDHRNTAPIDTGFDQAAQYRLRGDFDNHVDRYRTDAEPALLAKVVITLVLLSVGSD